MIETNLYKCHVIRDVFYEKHMTVVDYASNDKTIQVLRDSLFSIEGWHLYSNDNDVSGQYSRYWNLNVGDDIFFSDRFCDLFIIDNYDPIVTIEFKSVVNKIYNILKPNGILFLVNADKEFDIISRAATLRKDLVEETQKYSLYHHENVRIYQRL